MKQNNESKNVKMLFGLFLMAHVIMGNLRLITWFVPEKSVELLNKRLLIAGNDLLLCHL